MKSMNAGTAGEKPAMSPLKGSLADQLQAIYPVCFSLREEEITRQMQSACGLVQDADAFPDVLAQQTGGADHSFLSDLARLEQALYRVGMLDYDFSVGVAETAVNPTLQLLRFSWKNLMGLLDRADSVCPASPEPGDEMLMLWQDPVTKKAEARPASQEDLLVLKMVMEKIDPKDVASLGNLPVEVDKTGIDIAYSCSQKGLGCIPGLSPVTASPRAMDHLRGRRAPGPSFYLDLGLLDDYWAGHRYHHTASSPLFYALREALAIIDEEGLENRFRRVERNHRAFVAGIEAMGLQMHVAAEHRLPALAAVRVPAGVSDSVVRTHLLEDHGIEILGGFGLLAGQVFRIGLMGAGSTRENVLRVLGGLQAALAREGYRPAGNGVAAAEACYSLP